MKKNIYLITALLIFISFSCTKKEEEQPVKPSFELIKNDVIPAFDSDNAFDHISKFSALGPRVPNSKEHQMAKNYIITVLQPLADSLAITDFIQNGYENDKLNLTNITASFNPGAKNRIFLCAHWDSRPWADAEKDKALHTSPVLGANDGGSGVGVLLELAKVLHAKKVDYGIDLIFFDGEDYGRHSDLSKFFLGSTYFAQTKGSYSPAFGILLDLVGDKEAKFYKEESSIQAAENIVDLVWSAAAATSSKHFISEPKYAISDDHTPINQAGIKCIDIIDAELVGASENIGRRAYWHTLRDDIDNIGIDTIDDLGKVLNYFIYSLKFN